MKCPRCKTESLQKETLEGVEIDRCSKCQGTWLDDGELGKIVNTKELKFDPTQMKAAISAAFAGVPTDEKKSIELCPKCQNPMEAINYAVGSGIIIDRCFNNHGVWLDAKELDKAQMYIENGEAELDEHKEEWIAFAQSVVDTDKLAKDEERKSEMRPTKYLVNSFIRKIIGN